MTKLHLVYTPFTGVGLYGGYRGDDWFAERIRVFEKFTLPSLRQQTGFIHWMSFRPEEKHNPLLRGLRERLDVLEYPYVMTFNGLMYWDDKFPTGFFPKLVVLARHVRWVVRKGRWDTVLPMLKEVWWSKNETLEERIRHALKYLKVWYFARVLDVDRGPLPDVVYLTRIDSDDCFAQGVLERIRSVENTDVIACQKGYIYREETGELCTWEPPTNPPFHTIVFDGEEFFDAKSHVERYWGYRSHEDATSIGHVTYLPDGSYCVTVHGKGNHISTQFNHPFRGPAVENREEVLARFGIQS